MAYSRDANHASMFKLIGANRAILVVSLCAAFLFFKYMLQNFPSVMALQLMDSFHLQGLGLVCYLAFIFGHI